MSRLTKTQQRAVALAIYRRSPSRAIDLRTCLVAVALGRFDDSREASEASRAG